MRRACIFLIGALAAACGGSSNNTNTNAANMRGTNTNTGYFQNTNTSVPPAMPSNVTNISPPSLGNSHNGNTKSSANIKGSSDSVPTANANVKKH